MQPCGIDQVGVRVLAGTSALDREDRFFHADYLGTPRVETDRCGGVIATHTYTPFGTELTTVAPNDRRSPTSSLHHAWHFGQRQEIKFTGHERDSQGSPSTFDDLDYMHARFYSPETSRFLITDPVGGNLGSSQSWNRYTYVLNNPVLRIDPDGRVDQTGFDALNNMPSTPPGPLTVEKVAKLQNRLAKIGGASVAATAAYLSAGSSLALNVIVVGPLSNMLGGIVSRGADADDRTAALHPGAMSVDAVTGLAGSAIAGVSISGKVATSIDDAAGTGGARLVSELISNSAAPVTGEGLGLIAESIPTQGPNPAASDPAVNCHLQPGCPQTIVEDTDSDPEEQE